MTNTYQFKKKLGLILGCLAFALSGFNSYANLNGKWIQHSAFHNRSEDKESQVDRIIEGNRYVYFSVRGFEFNRSNAASYYTRTEGSYSSSVRVDNDPLQLFRYDKTLPWCRENIRPMSAELGLTGVFPNVMNYSPDYGVFVVIYEDRNMDFIYDDGRVVHSDVLRHTRASMPQTTPYSITFDNDMPYAYIACSFGYIKVNLTDGELDKFVVLDKPVAWAARVGKNMVVFAGSLNAKSYSTLTYIFPADDTPSVLTSPVSVKANLQALMPITDDSFLALSPNGSSETSNSIVLITIDDNGSVTEEPFETAYAVDNAATANFRHFFRTDGFISPAKDGYAIYNNDYVFLVKKGLARPTGSSIEEYKKLILTKISKSGLNSSDSENLSKAATFDGSRLWLYTYKTNGRDDLSPRGFYFKDYSNEKWSEKSEIATPNAPTTTAAAYAQWHEKNGLIIRGPGTFFSVNDEGDDKLCSFNNGEWTDRSYFANFINPNYGEMTLRATFVGIDPVFPDWIWGNSVKDSGVHRIDIGDYSNFFNFGTMSQSSNKQKKYPGYFGITPAPNSWSIYSGFTNVDFDVNGTMWFAQNYLLNKDNYYDLDDYKEAKVPLFYFTKEERAQLDHVTAPATTLKVHQIDVPNISIHHTSELKALKAPGNQNYLAISSRFLENERVRPFIYDHNGTLEDTSDDRKVELVDLHDEKGDPVPLYDYQGYYEDPATGELWFCTDNGPLILNPSEFFDGKGVVRRPRITRGNTSFEISENPLDQISIQAMIDDNLGRKWLATEEGLYCLSKDGAEILGHYTMENSPLPTDDVLNVACNMSSGSIFVLTTRGVVEFHPEGSFTSVPAGTHLSIWPSAIVPGYNGYINIDGAESGSSYGVYNNEGKLVLTLGTPEGNKLQWNGCDSQGKRVAPGRYNVRRSNMEETNSVIVME